MNMVFLTGRLVRDPELRQSKNGKAVCTFTLAVQETKDKANFINCVAWEKNAENINHFFMKGNPILVIGSWETRSYEKDGQKRTVNECRVSRFEFMGIKETYGTEPVKPGAFEELDDDSELPF